MNNAVVKLQVNKDFYNSFDRNLIEVKTKCTDKKRANGVVIPFSNEIILDEDGDDYILSIAGFWYEDEWKGGHDFDSTFFIVRLNDEQFNKLNNSINEFYKDYIYKKNGDFSFLCELLDSVGLLNIVKNSINEGYEFSKFSNFEELDSDSVHKIFVYLTKVGGDNIY